MATTTIEAVRDAMQTTIETIDPASHVQTKFLRERADVDFREWCEEQKQASFRRYAIADLFEYPEPDSSSGARADEQTTLELVIAYPKDYRYGNENREDAFDVIREDMTRVGDLIGVHRTDSQAGNFATIIQNRDIEEGEKCWFLVFSLLCIFRRAVV